MSAIVERVIVYGLIVGLCIIIGYLKNLQSRLEEDLKKCNENQGKILTFCKENEQTRDKVRKALENNKEGVDGFNRVLDTLFEGKK